MKTLIVEDDFTSRLLLQTFLARYGECHFAVNGEEAEKAFEVASGTGVPYDLICMDILMPGTHGTEVVRRLRDLEESRGIGYREGAKIIMTTGVTDMKEVFKSFNNLCNGYVTKPIDTAKLLKEIEKVGLSAVTAG
jgi:two-component system chemotaxis response regulator CheY